MGTGVFGSNGNVLESVMMRAKPCGRTKGQTQTHRANSVGYELHSVKQLLKSVFRQGRKPGRTLIKPW